MLTTMRQAMFARGRRDRGDILMSVLVLVIVSTLFASFVVSMAWLVSVQNRGIQRNALAQEAADVALAEAMWALNQEYGTVPRDSSVNAYLRSLPDEESRETADLTEFNATKQTTFHDVDPTGTYGIQAVASWWVDVYDVTYDESAGGDFDRMAKANVVGDLYVEAQVVNPEGIVYGYRAVKVPLQRLQARAVMTSTDGKGLRYVVSPLSLFQYGAFGTDGIEDARSGAAAIWTPVATSGNITLRAPQANFDIAYDNERRFDANMVFYGIGDCQKYDDASGTLGECSETRTLHTGFEIEPDVQVVTDMADYCSAQTTEDFIASEQANPQLVAGDTTYCFRDFTVDADVRLVAAGTGNQVVRVFVSRDLSIQNGARFLNASGASLHLAPETDPQIALYTDSSSVDLEGRLAGSVYTNKFYLYAPNATCTPGDMSSGASTTRTMQFWGSVVCQNVNLEWVRQVANHTPFEDLVEFGAAGFGSDLYPNNIWYINTESVEFVSRMD